MEPSKPGLAYLRVKLLPNSTTMQPDASTAMDKAANQIQSATDTMKHLLADSDRTNSLRGTALDEQINKLQKERSQLVSQLAEAEGDRERFRSRVAELDKADEKRRTDEKAQDDKTEAAVQEAVRETKAVCRVDLKKAIAIEQEKYANLRVRANEKIADLKIFSKRDLDARNAKISAQDIEIGNNKRKVEEADSLASHVARSAKVVKVAEHIVASHKTGGWKELAGRLDNLQEAVSDRRLPAQANFRAQVNIGWPGSEKSKEPSSWLDQFGSFDGHGG
ncbi:hypothetical protein LTR36_003494 [Oleoguttula mirabilis]|uniref:Uncharacterized protein n=1 Tax=Oleoguttula mirabilis TaxID=1507867 RepID=A0AAV9JJY6_9PEZI|nr:hypothetical protein LTR36_003494 [Oleoguttula mirabilis]